MSHLEENFEYLRQKMVLEHLCARDVKDNKVLTAFRKVPRHRFVNPVMSKDAYNDFPLSIGHGQTISQPYIVALMVQLLDVEKNDKVLEIGTGSGYETALLGELAGSVFSIERIPELAVMAKGVLEELHYKNIRLKIEDGSLGWKEFAPFNKIIVTASFSAVPEPLIDQLSEGGRLVMPVGQRYSQRLTVLEKNKEGEVIEKDTCGCVFVPLIGKYGWEE